MTDPKEHVEHRRILNTLSKTDDPYCGDISRRISIACEPMGEVIAPERPILNEMPIRPN
jgi:hypothetical protein